jgi:hypothetical protein
VRILLIGGSLTIKLAKSEALAKPAAAIGEIVECVREFIGGEPENLVPDQESGEEPGGYIERALAECFGPHYSWEASRDDETITGKMTVRPDFSRLAMIEHRGAKIGVEVRVGDAVGTPDLAVLTPQDAGAVEFRVYTDKPVMFGDALAALVAVVKRYSALLVAEGNERVH